MCMDRLIKILDSIDLIKIVDSIDAAISKRWDSRYDKERMELFDIREKVCKMIEERQRKK